MEGLITTTPPLIFDLMSNLADTTRSRLLLVLEGHDFTVSELCTILQMPQSTVSRHLKVLVDDGWLTSQPDGTARRYRMLSDQLTVQAKDLWLLVGAQASVLSAARQDSLRVKSVVAGQRSRSQEFFAAAAGDWDRLRRELFGAGVDLQALYGLIDDRWCVGDLGCGTGRVAESLAPFVARVIAVDSSREMLAAARNRLQDLDGVDVRSGALEALPIENDELDAAVFFLVLHHVVEPRQALAEAARVIRPGGRLLIADMTPHDRRGYQTEMGHAWLGFSQQQMQSWLTGAGFEGVTYHALAPDPDASGPAVFAAAARRVAG